jgi:prepilin-type N-terminal cleavage/methylation domain-containing protein
MVISTAETVRERKRSGFSLVELMVAIVILSVGVLSMAGTSTWVVRQITLSWLTTERAVARQSAIETILAGSFENATGGSATYGDFDVNWTLAEDAGNYRTLRIVTVGLGKPKGTPGMTVLSGEVADTVFLRYASPGF